MFMDNAYIPMAYAISAPDLLALSPTVRALVVVMLRPHLTADPDPVTTQRGERILPLEGDEARVRRAIYRVQTLDREGACLRFYVSYAPGLWDVAPLLEAAARMQAEEARHG